MKGIILRNTTTDCQHFFCNKSYKVKNVNIQLTWMSENSFRNVFQRC